MILETLYNNRSRWMNPKPEQEELEVVWDGSTPLLMNRESHPNELWRSPVTPKSGRPAQYALKEADWLLLDAEETEVMATGTGVTRE